MSQFLKQNIYQPKNLTENRVLMLTEKINALKLGNKVNIENKFDSLQKQVSDVQKQLQQIIMNFNDRNYQLKHIFSKINKELSYDYMENDRCVREQTQQCQQLALALINHHVQQRKDSDSRISRFIDQKCAVIRDLVQRQSKERVNVINEVEGSLVRDLGEIRDKLDNDSCLRKKKVEEIHEEFLSQYEQMRGEFQQMHDKYSSTQQQFYKMLRDIVKKVKSELSQGKKQRQSMQQSILVLVQKLCDKAIEEVGTK